MLADSQPDNILLAIDAFKLNICEIDLNNNKIAILKASNDFSTPLTFDELMELINSEDNSWVNNYIDHFKQDGTEFSIVFRLLSKSGEYRWIKAISKKLSNNKMLLIFKDVHEDKKIEFALYDYYSDLEQQLLITAEEATKGNKKFKELVESINDIIWETDINQRFTYISPKISNILGYSQNELIGKTATVFLSDEEMGIINKTAQECVEKNIEFKVEALRHTHKNGGELYLDITGSIILDDFLEPAGFRGTARDVTEKKKAKDDLLRLNSTLEQKVSERTTELAEAYAELENIFNTSRDGIAIFDLQTMFLDANPAYQKMLGYTKEELKEKSCVTLSAVEDLERAKQVLQTVLTDGYVDSFEKKCITKSGKKIHVQMSLALMPCKTKIIAATKDITTEQEYKNTISRYITLTDEHVISSKTSPDGTIVFASQAMCDISGYKKNELIGKNHNILRHPDMSKSVYRSLWETIKKGETWKGEIKNITKNNTSYWTSNIISPEYDENGKHIGYMSIKHDITDKKLLEEISITDELTKLYNRRHFNTEFFKAIDESHKNGDFFIFTIFDIDNFKKYNDTYGHSSGDNTLKSVANTAKSIGLKTNSTAFRIGGEEFAIICSAKTKDECLRNIKEIKDAIQSLEIPHEKNDPYRVVTASFGVYGIDCSKKDTKPTMDYIYKTSDELLYKAKESGRNKIHSLFE